MKIQAEIRPRRASERGGYVCMPLTANIPRGRRGWRRTGCPECGRECWMRPEAQTLKERQGAILLCTYCAIRKGMGGKDGKKAK